MINAKMIARIMGALFFIEAGFLILCSFLAVYYNESDISAFLYSAAITAGAGSIAALAGKNAEKRISRRYFDISVIHKNLIKLGYKNTAIYQINTK